MTKILFTSLAAFIFSGLLINSAWALDCNSANITLTSQSEVDAFQADFGEGGSCSEVTGSLTIEGINIVDLAPLLALETIGDNLIVRSNPKLADLDGLASINSVGGNVWLLENAILDQCASLKTLLDDVDDGEPGPGPGPAGIPDVGGELSISNNDVGCNSLEEILASGPFEAFASFLIYKEFSDHNPVAVLTNLKCENATSVVAIDANASEMSPANFRVGWLSSDPSPSCTATEEDVLAGYTVRQRDCEDVGVELGSDSDCTILNVQSSIPISVYKDFLDGNPEAVTVILGCEDGFVGVNDETASMSDAANFRAYNIPYDGTTCSAEEDLPDGYELADSTCEELVVTPGAYVSCQITNKPVTSDVPDLTAMTGSWYAPESSGEGFMVHRVSEELAVAYFYGYNNLGQQLWLLGASEGPFAWGEPVLFEVERARGGTFTDYNSNNVSRRAWGSFVFTQWDCDRATISLTGRDGEKTLYNDRLALTSGTKCSGAENSDDSDGVTGSWYEATTTGQGFAIHKVSADRGVVYFYGFNNEGQNLWLTGVWESEWVFGQEMLIELDLVTGGTFDEVDPDDIIRELWGTLTLVFDDCENGSAKLEGLDGVQELDIELLAGSLGLECQSVPD